MTTQKTKEKLREKLWQEVMEDYVVCAELGHLAKDQAKHKAEMRGHLSRLVDFFWNEIQKREGELIKKIEKLYQDEHPVDCIDGITPVETYGYEETHNRALKQVITLIKSNE